MSTVLGSNLYMLGAVVAVLVAVLIGIWRVSRIDNYPPMPSSSKEEPSSQFMKALRQLQQSNPNYERVIRVMKFDVEYLRDTPTAKGASTLGDMERFLHECENSLRTLPVEGKRFSKLLEAYRRITYTNEKGS